MEYGKVQARKEDVWEYEIREKGGKEVLVPLLASLISPQLELVKLRAPPFVPLEHVVSSYSGD